MHFHDPSVPFTDDFKALWHEMLGQGLINEHMHNVFIDEVFLEANFGGYTIDLVQPLGEPALFIRAIPEKRPLSKFVDFIIFRNAITLGSN